MKSKRSTIEWATEIAPWNSVIEAGRSVWRDRWAFLNLATVAAGIRSTAEKCSDSPELLDTTRSLARRVRYARLRSGAHKWWRIQLETYKSEDNVLFILLPMLTWTTTSVLLANADLLDTVLEKLPPKEWLRLFWTAQRCASMARPHEERRESIDADKLPNDMRLRLAAVLSSKLEPHDSRIIYGKYIKDQETEDTVIVDLVQREALDVKNFGTASWAPNLELVQHCYELGVVFEPPAFRRNRNQGEPGMMALDIANAILRSPGRFPGFLVTAAEERCRNDVASKVTPVGAIAEKERWFVTS